MSAKRLVLWRHGQTDYNTQGRVQGSVDVPLNADGLAQAQAGARALVDMGPLRIVSSPLGRALQTAQQLAELAGVDVATDERLRERSFGVLEGLDAKEARQRYPQEYEQWRTLGESPRADVERRGRVGERVAAAIRGAFKDCPSSRTLVVVSHGSALTQGLVTLLGLDPSAWCGIRGLDNTHWAVLVPSTRPPKWRLVAHNLGAPPRPHSDRDAPAVADEPASGGAGWLA